MNKNKFFFLGKESVKTFPTVPFQLRRGLESMGWRGSPGVEGGERETDGADFKSTLGISVCQLVTQCQGYFYNQYIFLVGIFI